MEIDTINDYIDDRGESMLAQSIDELKEEGLKQGIERGIEQGIEQGIERERSMQEELRKQEKLETIRKMLAEGLDIKMISHISGLSIAEIEKLKA